MKQTTKELIEKNTKCSIQDLTNMGYNFSHNLGMTKVYVRENKSKKYFIYWHIRTEQISGVQTIKKEKTQ